MNASWRAAKLATLLYRFLLSKLKALCTDARAKENHDSNDHEPRRRSGRLSQAVDVRPQPRAPPAAPKPDFNGPADRNTNLKNSPAEVSPVGGADVRHQPGLDRRCLAGHGGQGFALVLHPARRRLITHPLRPADRARVRHQPVLHLLRGPDRRHQPRLVRDAPVRLEAARRKDRPGSPFGRLAGPVQPDGSRLPDLLRPHRRRRHRMAQQRDLDRTDRGRCHAGHQRPLEGSSGLSPGSMSGTRHAAWVPGR